jgi:tungstate transport system ATP-binding protein
VIEPEILFLDEPTASVDQRNTEVIESIILKMKQERLVAVVMTTHDKEQAGRLADRLMVMKDRAIHLPEIN